MCGIRNLSTRKKLLNEDRTFQDALKVAVADEVASKETLEVQNDPKPDRDSVHSVGKTGNTRYFSSSKNTVNQDNLKSPLPTFPKSFYACYSCGSPDHSRAYCKYPNVICSRCKRPGHIARVCKKGNMQNNSVEQKLDSAEVFLEEELYALFDVDSLFTSEIFCSCSDRK